MHLSMFAFGVVAAQITGIRVRLINVCIGRADLALEFDDDNAFPIG
jgi:hypothetical protein